MTQTFRWATLDVYTVLHFTPAQLADLLTFGEPHGIIITIPSSNQQPDVEEAVSFIREQFDGLIWIPDTPPDESLAIETTETILVGTPHAKMLAGVEYLFVSTDELLSASGGNGGFVFANDVDIHVDTSALETTLVGLDAFLEHQSKSENEYMYTSTKLDSDYFQQWDETVIGGIGMIQSGGMKKIPIIECHPDTTYTTTFIKHTQLGLRKIEGVGYKTRYKINDAGYETQDDISDADSIFLADDADLQPWRAERIVKSARAHTQTEIVYDDVPELSPLPAEPIIVTGMTNPPNETRCWQLFVSDSELETWDVFQDISREETGQCYQEFILWYLSEGEKRPIIVWDSNIKRLISNGIQRYAPDYLSTWEDCDVYTIEDIVDDRNVFVPIYGFTVGNLAYSVGSFDGGLWENYDVFGHKFTRYMGGGDEFDVDKSIKELLHRHKLVTQIYDYFQSTYPRPDSDDDDADNERDEDYEAVTLEGKRRKLLSS